jgi:hypothetical protein
VKTRNLVLSAVIVVVLAAGGAIWWLYASLDMLAKLAIERLGSEITGVAVRVDSVRIEATEGRGTIRGLLVGNPKGFEAPHALKLGEMHLALDPASLAKGAVLIRELVLAAPEVVYERGQGSDNLALIQKAVNAWVEKHAGASKPDGGAGMKFVVERVTVRDGVARFGTAASLPIPDLQLRDVGKKSGGASAGEVVKQVWDAILRSITVLALKAGGAIKDAAKGALEGVQKLFK